MAFFLFATICACGQKAPTYQAQYDLGAKYLDEGNYQEAVAAFTAAIEIEPNHAEAYIGLSDAYVGLGDLDAAKKALTDGLAAYGDNADLQAKLDAFDLTADDANLTGQPPFSEADLESWGYPVGMSVYELRAAGILPDRPEHVTVDEWIESSKAGLGDAKNRDSGAILRDSNPQIAVSSYDFSLMSVEIEGSDTVSGPRGVCLGMTMETVLNLFRCDEPKALAFARTGDETLLTPRDGFSSLSLYTIYPDGQTPMGAGTYWDGHLTIQRDGRRMISYGIPSAETSDKYADFAVTFHGGVVSDIWVSYW